MFDLPPIDRGLLRRLGAAFRDVPRVAYAGAHVYPAAAPDFTPAPRTERPPTDHPYIRMYVHIPFCKHRCSYCYYAVKVTEDRDVKARYVDALLRELEWVEPGTPLGQLFVGGGTPTALPPDLLAVVLDAIYGRTVRHGNPMHVVEASPDTVTPAHATVLRERGVRRVSMGVQTLDPPILDTVRRTHGVTRPVDAVRLLVEQGFILNVDLIYGLPGQTVESFRRDFHRLVAEGVHSITAYDLRVTNNMLVAQRLQEEEWLSLERLMKWRMALKLLVDEVGFSQTRWHTYQRLDGPAPKHWRAASHTRSSDGYQFGIGLSARSHLGPVVYRNHKGFDAYLERIESNESPVEDLFALNDEDRRVQHICRSIGDGRPLDAKAYEASFGTQVDDEYGEILTRLTDAGAIARTDVGYELTDVGKLLYDLVVLAFYPRRAQDWLRNSQPAELTKALV